VATYLKTFQALSYERLEAAFADLFGVAIGQGGLMNMLRRTQGRFETGRDAAVATLRQAKVVASDETGVRIEGSNAYHWVFRCDEAVVHQAASTPRASSPAPTGSRPSSLSCRPNISAQKGLGNYNDTAPP
jgi:transposase